jgi:hypothetical protein
MKETLQLEISELYEMKRMIETPTFQKYIAKPLKAERDKLRTSFFSDSLKHSWRKGGKQEGIELCMKLLEAVNVDLNNKKFELEQLDIS